MKYLLRLALIFVFSTATHAQCFQIESILVDACGAQEGLNEMVRFRVGATAINTSNMSVAWPNNGWQGLVQNATTAAKVATLNADILAAGGCGQIIQPTGGVLPANATVILVTSFNMDPSLNQFGPITGNIYILFQNNATNANGHFANYGTGTRTLAISFGACNDSVTYDRSLLVDQSGSSGAADGATVLFTPAGQATYINNGCQAPVPPFTVEAGNPVSGCAGSTVTLSGSAQGQTSVLWTAPSGTFANSANAATTYTISPTATGTITLTLTATNACGTSISDTVNVTVTNPTTPNFPTTQTYCTGATIPALATTSPNGISGTWSPSTVSNTASGSYVFTPNAGQCATSVTLNVTITNSITPDFPTSQTYCTGATIPALATTSPNGITGTWSPSTVNNTASGSYVFTPSPNQCATSVTLNVTITNSITPDFATSQTYCSGATIPALATTSPNGITGTWSPSTINNTTSGSYVFTPNAGQCATSVTLNVTITNQVTPNFPTTQTYCSGATIPALATTSPNGITGTWSPSTVNNTTSGSYVFTPNAGQCATSVTLNVTITNSITPDFATSQTYCSGATVPALATTSPNGVSGTWSPSTINNTTSGSYVFTPNAGQCATSVTLNVTITNPATPNFPTTQTYCSGATVPALATTSPNGITGTWSPSTINNTTSGSYVFTPNAGQCATSVTLNVTITNPVTPNFPTTQTYCSGATVPALATTSPNGITGTWSPSTINNTTSGSYVFTPNTGQCATSVTLNVTINPTVTPNFATTQTYCSGATVPALATTSPNGITGTWSPSTINNTTSGSYVFTPNAGQCATSVTLNVTINPAVIPNFATTQTYCSGATVPALATTSPNGITGTWSPSTVNNTTSGSYVFTPNTGQCATSVTLNVTITNPVTPNFPTTQTYCSGATIPALATTSPNGITGTWSPSTINNTTSGSYVFTPNTGQCATSVTLNVTINPTVTPNFATTQTYCSGATVPALATTSPNGITGTWSPSTINNTTSGSYVFTPNTGQCATSVTLNVTINPTVIPNFATAQTYCSGATVPALATTSPNGITGTWSPSTINNTSSGSYVFTPNAGQCATSVTLNVTITNPVTPNFPTTQTYCSGATIPALAATSPNGITGTWSPSTVNNTTSGSYVFTPNAGQCATSVTLNVTINPTVIPNFATTQTYCSGATVPALATTSPNGITGTWSPSTINNTTSGSYVFTPNAGQCATSVTLNVTINPTVTPNFPTAQTYCSGATIPALAATSPNGISGTWSPSTINNTTSGSYVFTPNAGQCATSVTLNVTITNPVTPNFPTTQTYCSGATIPALATTSPNGITGTWSPSTVNNITSGSYVFTPNAGQCATSTTLNVTINPTIVPDFPTALTICAGDSVPTLSTASPNGVAGTWSPGAVNNMQSATYVFTPTAGQCAQPVNFVVTVNALPNPVLTDGTICAANGSPTTSYLLDTGLSASAYTFVWTLGTQTLATTGPSHSAVLPGTYMVTATDNATGCSNSATATVTQVGEISVTATTPVDFSSHNNIVVTVTGGSGQFAYLLDGQQLQTTNVFYNVPAGDHTIQVTDEKGCGVATVDVSFLDYPHFFTPNGDGFNDYWNIKGLSGQADARIMIFDRYGKLIKQIKPSDTSGWDGTYTGRELPSTDYWFVLEYHDRQGGAKEFKAHFSLKR